MYCGLSIRRERRLSMPSATTPARSGCLHVEAITCDMNADFERASLKRCPHIVYEYFHLVKNFNEKVISDVRKDEQARLKDEGSVEAARALKHSKYILMSCADTRDREERDALEGRLVSRGSAPSAGRRLCRRATPKGLISKK
ncbi:MAG: transposase [Coriobacteriaceae bacterium]